MSTKANLIENVIVGEYGYPVFLALVDENTDPISLAGYDTIQVVLRSPDKLKTITSTATLYSDGKDGKLYFTPGSTDIDRAGTWKCMIKMIATGVSVAKSEIFDMVVIDSL